MNATSIGVEAISFYQKRISPKKGFRCAHSVFHGGLSCSEFGKRSLQRYGYMKFAVLMSKRFSNCQTAMDELKKIEKEKKNQPDPDHCFTKTWAGFEVGCCLASILGS